MRVAQLERTASGKMQVIRNKWRPEAGTATPA